MDEIKDNLPLIFLAQIDWSLQKNTKISFGIIGGKQEYKKWLMMVKLIIVKLLDN